MNDLIGVQMASVYRKKRLLADKTVAVCVRSMETVRELYRAGLIRFQWEPDTDGSVGYVNQSLGAQVVHMGDWVCQDREGRLFVVSETEFEFQYE